MDWIAQYNDGEIRSVDGAKYKDINRFKLEKFVLLHKNKPLVVLNLDGNKRLIMRMRNAISVHGGDKYTVWIVGWQETVNGVNRQMICFVFPDGTVEITDGFKEGHKWFYPVVFRQEEL